LPVYTAYVVVFFPMYMFLVSCIWFYLFYVWTKILLVFWFKFNFVCLISCTVLPYYCLPTLLKNLSSPWFLVLSFLCSVLYIVLFVPCPYSFDNCVVWPSIYWFWLPLWYLQTLLLKWPSAYAYAYPLNKISTFYFDKW
jgi:hypothetical protein